MNYFAFQNFHPFRPPQWYFRTTSSLLPFHPHLISQYQNYQDYNPYNFNNYYNPYQSTGQYEENQKEYLEKEENEEDILVLNEELIKRFAETELRRKERHKQRKLEEDQIVHVEESYQPTSLRKDNHFDTQQKIELYGNLANKIGSLEGSLNAIYDQMCDKYQPRLWPIVPFK